MNWNNRSERPRWRKGTADEWRAIRVSLRAETYQRNYVQGCDSSLVNDLLKAANGGELDSRGDLAEGFGYDEIRNLYANVDEWDADKCREYISDHGLDEPDKPTIDCEACNSTGTCLVSVAGEDDDCHECNGEGSKVDPDADDDDGYLNGLRDACREHAHENPAEVYEWWRVDSWLCEQLHSIGEVTIDNGYGHWWGRTCTGQSMLMDGTLQLIAAKFERGTE